MATKNYMINDKWLDLDKQNIVELQSVDGEIDSVKVNGSEIETPSGKITITENGTDIDVAQYALADVNVEGGGGSSDFSAAEVTFNSSNGDDIPLMFPVTSEDGMNINYLVPDGSTMEIPLYKGACFLGGNEYYEGDYSDFSATGDIEIDTVNAMITVTGNGTITYTPA